MTERILIVDDDASFRRIVEYSLQEEGYQTSSFGDSEKALHAFMDSEFSLVLTDMRMPRLSGLDLLTRIHAVAPNVPVIVVTGHPEVETAVEAMRAGAFDYLQKPVNREQLKLVIGRGLLVRRHGHQKRDPRRATS
jgi:DNA-binding NtrC family response regulator